MFGFKASKRKRPVAKRPTGVDSSESENDVDKNATNGFQEISTIDAIQAAKKKRKEKKKKRKLKQNSNLSFTLGNYDDEDGDDGSDNDGVSSKRKSRKSKKKRKKKIGGLGFGGGMQTAIDDDEDENQDENRDKLVQDDDDDDEPAAGSSFYSKDYLESLKSEQKVYIAEKEEDDEEVKRVPMIPVGDVNKDQKDANITKNIPIPLPPLPEISMAKAPEVKEEEFISLNIISGDDALKYTENQSDDEKMPCCKIQKDEVGTTILSNKNSNNLEIQKEVLQGEAENNAEDEEGRKWEEEVAKRAGVGTEKSLDQTSQQESSSEKDHGMSNEESTRIVCQIKETIASSLSALKQKDQDLESSLGRRRHEAEAAQIESKKKEEEISNTGEKFEYYQNLRSALAEWVSAMRYLSDKVSVIEDAIGELIKEMGTKRITRMKEWEDDEISLLKENQVLDYVVGRQPISLSTGESKLMETEPIVDEFGRDIRSMESLAVTKRKVERERRRLESSARSAAKKDPEGALKPTDVYSDEDVSDNEIMEREDRRSSLSDAVQVIFDEMDESYTSLLPLIDIFKRWKDFASDDYKQCYANLALVGFISIFAKAEFCKKLDIQSFMSDGIMALDDSTFFKDYKMSKLMSDFQNGDKGDIHKSHWNEILHQNISDLILQYSIGTFNHLSDESAWSYDPYSTKQTRLLCSMLKPMLSSNAIREDEKKRIHEKVLAYLNGYLQETAIAVTKKESELSEREGTSLNTHATSFLTSQLRRLRKLVYNIATFWYPTLDQSLDVAKFCLLDIIAYRLLPVIGNIPGDEKARAEANSIFESTLKVIREAGWLDSEDLMLFSSPIRAEAMQLGIV